MKKRMQTFSLRLPLELKERLDIVSKDLSKPKSSIVREALEAYLNDVGDYFDAVNALEELKDGDYKKASKKIDKVIKNLQEEDEEDSGDFSDLNLAIDALEELKEGDYKKASKKIDSVVKNFKNKP